jgi:hypothetical protein
MNRVVEIVKWSVVGVALAVAAVYAGDYLVVRYHMASGNTGAAFGSVVMNRLYAIPLKNGKTEYELDAQQPQVTVQCVHSLFPHMGYSPCWYLQRNSQTPIPMVIVPPFPRMEAVRE